MQSKFYPIVIFISIFFVVNCGVAQAECDIGAFVGNEDHRAPYASEVQNFENLVGHHLNSILVYWAWNDGDFPAAGLNGGVRYHDGYDTQTILHLTWEPWSRLGGADNTYPLTKIINGDFDNYITKFAQDCAVWSDPIRLRFAHEMIQDDNPDTTGWYPWQDRPAEYVQAYSHVYNIFKEQGANNVEFVWNPINYPSDKNTVTAYYPGKDKVDWIGMDGYNLGEDGQPGWPYWQNFDDIFYNIYHLFLDNPDIFGDKKIMLAEFASLEGMDPQEKAYWIQYAFNAIKNRYPEIAAFYWFNVNEWRINSSEASLEAFQLAMSDQYYISHVVAEPSTISLLGLGLLGLLRGVLKPSKRCRLS